MSAALQNVTVIKPRGVQQKLLNISKVDGQRSAVVRGVVRVGEKAEQTAARLTAERRNAETPEQSAARRSSQRDCRQRRPQQLKSAVSLMPVLQLRSNVFTKTF